MRDRRRAVVLARSPHETQRNAGRTFQMSLPRDPAITVATVQIE
jgi:hypothetical protein